MTAIKQTFDLINGLVRPEKMISKCGKVTLEMGQDELEEPVMILRFAEGTNTYKVCLPKEDTDDTED